MLQPCIVVILQEVQNLVLEGFSTSRPYPGPHQGCNTAHFLSLYRLALLCSLAFAPATYDRTAGLLGAKAVCARLIHPRLNKWKGRGPKKTYKRYETSPSPIINKISAAQR